MPQMRSVSWFLLLQMMTGTAGQFRVARDRARHLEAVRAGHDDVHQDQLRTVGADLGQRFLAVVGGGDGKAVLTRISVR
jgi:hypothetical protein